MIFYSLILTENGVITAKAEGHADEVVKVFREVSSLLLSPKGPWRMTEVKGTISDGAEMDSEMEWTLSAKSKNALV
jgi:hypothetical protein